MANASAARAAAFAATFPLLRLQLLTGTTELAPIRLKPMAGTEATTRLESDGAALLAAYSECSRLSRPAPRENTKNGEADD